MADAQPSKQKKGKLFCLIGYFESVYSILLGVWGAELTNVTNVHLNLTLNFMYICKYTGDYSQACVWEYLGIWHLLAVDYPWNLWAVVCCSLEKLQFHIHQNTCFSFEHLIQEIWKHFKRRSQNYWGFFSPWSVNSLKLKMGVMCACWKSN